MMSPNFLAIISLLIQEVGGGIREDRKVNNRKVKGIREDRKVVGGLGSFLIELVRVDHLDDVHLPNFVT